MEGRGEVSRALGVGVRRNALRKVVNRMHLGQGLNTQTHTNTHMYFDSKVRRAGEGRGTHI